MVTLTNIIISQPMSEAKTNTVFENSQSVARGHSFVMSAKINVKNWTPPFHYHPILVIPWTSLICPKPTCRIDISGFSSKTLTTRSIYLLL